MNFACVNHEKWAVRFSVRACTNIFYNNEQKITNQSVRKDQIKDFNPFSANFTKWSKTLKQSVGNLPTNCLSVFGHLVGLALKDFIKRQRMTKAYI